MKTIARYTKEQRQFLKKETLSMLKEGIGQNEIARRLGVSIQYISNIKKRLIEENLITQKEIDQKKQTLLEKKQNEKKQLSRKKSKDEIDKEIQDKMKKVLELFKQGKSEVEVKKILKIPSSTIYRYENILIKEGLITKKEIVRQRDKNSAEMDKKITRIKELLQEGKLTYNEIAKEVNISEKIVYLVKKDKYEQFKVRDRNKEKNKEKREIFRSNPDAKKNLTGIELDVYNELINGYKYYYIEKKLGITHEKCMHVVENLQIVGVLSRKEIKEAQEKRKEKDKEEIVKQFRQGYSRADIIRRNEHLNKSSIYRMVVELKSEGRITQEEIDTAQNDNNIEYLNLVLKGMKKGLTVKEIIALDETGYLSESIVRRMKKRILESKTMNPTIFNKKNKKRRENQITEWQKECDNEYIVLLKKGLTFEEIATIRGIKSQNVRTRWYRLRDEYNITKEQLEIWRENRRKNFENGKNALDKYINEGKEIKGVKNFFETCIEEKNFRTRFFKRTN